VLLGQCLQLSYQISVKVGDNVDMGLEEQDQLGFGL